MLSLKHFLTRSTKRFLNTQFEYTLQHFNHKQTHKIDSYNGRQTERIYTKRHRLDNTHTHALSNNNNKKRGKLELELRKTGWYVSIKIVKFKTVEMDLVSLVIKDLTKHINFHISGQLVKGNNNTTEKIGFKSQITKKKKK